MALTLPVKIGEVRHRQHYRASAWLSAEQGSFEPVLIPLLPKRPLQSRRFGPLQILMNGSEANRTTAGDCPQPQTQSKLQSKNFLNFAHGQSPGWQAILPFSGRLPTTVLSSAAGLTKIRAQAERDSGIGLKLFGFIAESVFTFIPESCPRSPRNSVRNHPGIAFTFPRIPHTSLAKVKISPREDERKATRMMSILPPKDLN
jgi:hypothetical protein